MSAQPQTLRIINPSLPGKGAMDVLHREASNEFVFAVVGHAGSGTTVIAKNLVSLISEMKVADVKFDVVLLKARQVIEEWASAKGREIPKQTEKRSLADVQKLQDYGDEMRDEPMQDGLSDHSAVARGLIGLIQRESARRTGVAYVPGEQVKPDGKPRAYLPLSACEIVRS